MLLCLGIGCVFGVIGLLTSIWAVEFAAKLVCLISSGIALSASLVVLGWFLTGRALNLGNVARSVVHHWDAWLVFTAPAWFATVSCLILWFRTRRKRAADRQSNIVSSLQQEPDM